MNKQEFLAELRRGLDGLPQDDIKQSLDYYSEIIDDRIDDGIDEAEAIAALGDPRDIVSQILIDTPMQKLVKAKAKPDHKLSVTEIVLLCLGSPIWLSLCIAAAAVVLAVYIVLWSVIVSFYAVAISFAAVCVGGIAAGILFMYMGKIPQGIAVIGAALIFGGLSIFAIMGVNCLTKYFAILSKKIWILIKKCFVGKGKEQ